MNIIISKHFKMQLKKVVTTFFMVFLFNMSIAQPGGGGPSGGDPGDCNDCPPTGAVPLDGGLTLLAAAGIAYGTKKAHDYRRNKR